MPASLHSATEKEIKDEVKAAKLIEMLALENGQDNNARSTQIKKVEANYQKLLQTHPDNEEVLIAYAQFLWGQHRTKEALQHWQQAEKINPNHPELLNDLAHFYLSLGDETKGSEYLAKASSQNPQNALYQYQLANAYFLFRHELAKTSRETDSSFLKRALHHYEKASLLEPANSTYAQGYAEAFYNIPNPDWAKAFEAWKHFSEITPHKDFAYSHLARVSLKRNRPKDAEFWLSKIQDPKFNGLKEKLRKQIEGNSKQKR